MSLSPLVSPHAHVAAWILSTLIILMSMAVLESLGAHAAAEETSHHMTPCFQAAWIMNTRTRQTYIYTLEADIHTFIY